MHCENVLSNPPEQNGGIFHPLWILQSMIMTVLNKPKGELYNTVECIMTEHEGKNIQNKKGGIFHPQWYVSVTQRYASVAILSEK